MLPAKLARPKAFALHGVLGIALVAVAWPASWLKVDPIGQYSFFPLWLGYILTVDALVLRRTGTSLLARDPGAFAGMFLLSVPLWWTFEGINHFTGNWHYLGAEDYSTLKYVLVASWHFSTVVPAVFETAELLGSFDLRGAFGRWPAVEASPGRLFGAMGLGLLLLAALLTWPRYLFPVTWLCLFLVLDPLNCLRGRPSVLGRLGQGDWRSAGALAGGALVCGWFWEMWNYWALPKWEYAVPYVDFGRVFEMPLLGYGGYLPFGLEVYAGYQFLRGLLPWAPEVRLRISGPADARAPDRPSTP